MSPWISPAENPAVLVVGIVAACALLGLIVKMLASASRRRKERPFRRGPWDRREGNGGLTPPPSPVPRPMTAAKLAIAADQLRIVMSADFATQPLLNRSEARVFAELDRAVAARNPDWRVMAQVSLGEILVSRDPTAYRCINSKRVDLLLMDGDCQPRHAIEYQGGAHHQGSAAARDAVKKEALRRAGIGYHEVVAGFTTPAELRRLVDKLVEQADVPARA